MKIKVEEVCCGFTLRTGTLILLQLFLIWDSFLFYVYLTDLLYNGLPLSLGLLLEKNIRTHHLFGYALGVVTNFLGIVSIQMNMPKLLTCSIFYFCYYAIYYIVGVSILIISPTTYQDLIWGTETTGLKFMDGNIDPVVPNIFAYISFIFLMAYFAIVAKSCRDAMLKDNHANDAVEIPDSNPPCYFVSQKYV